MALSTLTLNCSDTILLILNSIITHTDSTQFGMRSRLIIVPYQHQASVYPIPSLSWARILLNQKIKVNLNFQNDSYIWIRILYSLAIDHVSNNEQRTRASGTVGIIKWSFGMKVMTLNIDMITSNIEINVFDAKRRRSWHSLVIMERHEDNRYRDRYMHEDNEFSCDT